MPLSRVGVKGSLAERAYEALKLAIVDRTLKPGEVLNEDALAEQMGISRTPLRAALIRLQYERLITRQPGRGYRVASLSRSEMEHVFLMRRLLEPPAAQLAALHRAQEDAARLHDLVRRQAREVARGSYLSYLRYDGEFHLHVASVARNPYLASAIRTLQVHVQRFLVLDEAVRTRADQSLDEHAAIAAAIEERDAHGAKQRMLAHIRKTERILAQVLR